MNNDINQILDHLDLKKSRKRWRWIALGAIVALLIGVLVPLFQGMEPNSKHVARIFIQGLITGNDEQLALIKDLREDENVEALIVRIDSPGGTTAGSEALYEELRAFTAKKPAVAVMDTVAASGGYITAIATDHIVARGNTITGSIGVIFSYPEISGLLNSIGVKMEELKSGELKAEPSPYKPASEKAKQVSMAMVEDGFVWFKGLVSERRKLSVERTALLSDGRVYTGRQALKEGLIDALGDEEEALGWLSREKQISLDLPIFTRLPAKTLAESYLGSNAAKALLELLGLSRLAETVARTKLDGLLVLWHPDF